MPRPKAVIPDYEFRLCIPQDLFGQLTLELWSQVEGRVPHGQYKRFFEARLREYFSRARLDLATLVPDLPAGSHFIYGSAQAITILKEAHLEALSRT